MSLVDSVKRAPRWAWVTAAGLGIGAAGIKLWNGRDAEQSNATVGTQVDPITGYPIAPTNSVANPVATIVPPVIIGNDGGDSMAGVGALQDLYTSAVQGLLSSYQDVWGPVQTAQLTLLTGNAETIQALALAGSAPNSSTPPPAAIVAQPAPVPAAPVALPTPKPATPAPAFKVVYENRTRDNGKSGAARLVWCNRVTIHRYPDGRGVVVAEDKIRNGAC